MTKLKLFLLTIITFVAMSIIVQPTFAQERDSVLLDDVSINSTTIFYSKEYPKTDEAVKWVSVVRNGKVYSGNIYNRGTITEFVSYFSGTLRQGPYMPTNVTQEK